MRSLAPDSGSSFRERESGERRQPGRGKKARRAARRRPERERRAQAAAGAALAAAPAERGQHRRAGNTGGRAASWPGPRAPHRPQPGRPTSPASEGLRQAGGGEGACARWRGRSGVVRLGLEPAGGGGDRRSPPSGRAPGSAASDKGRSRVFATRRIQCSSAGPLLLGKSPLRTFRARSPSPTLRAGGVHQKPSPMDPALAAPSGDSPEVLWSPNSAPVPKHTDALAVPLSPSSPLGRTGRADKPPRTLGPPCALSARSSEARRGLAPVLSERRPLALRGRGARLEPPGSPWRNSHSPRRLREERGLWCVQAPFPQSLRPPGQGRARLGPASGGGGVAENRSSEAASPSPGPSAGPRRLLLDPRSQGGSEGGGGRKPLPVDRRRQRNSAPGRPGAAAFGFEHRSKVKPAKEGTGSWARLCPRGVGALGAAVSGLRSEPPAPAARARSPEADVARVRGFRGALRGSGVLAAFACRSSAPLSDLLRLDLGAPGLGALKPGQLGPSPEAGENAPRLREATRAGAALGAGAGSVLPATLEKALGASRALAVAFVKWGRGLCSGSPPGPAPVPGSTVLGPQCAGSAASRRPGPEADRRLRTRPRVPGGGGSRRVGRVARAPHPLLALSPPSPPAGPAPPPGPGAPGPPPGDASGSGPGSPSLAAVADRGGQRAAASGRERARAPTRRPAGLFRRLRGRGASQVLGSPWAPRRPLRSPTSAIRWRLSPSPRHLSLPKLVWPPALCTGGCMRSLGLRPPGRVLGLGLQPVACRVPAWTTEGAAAQLAEGPPGSGTGCGTLAQASWSPYFSGQSGQGHSAIAMPKAVPYKREGQGGGRVRHEQDSVRASFPGRQSLTTEEQPEGRVATLSQDQSPSPLPPTPGCS
ncbi:collagen alpha-1(I) chain-like [Artibeus jamaicensis]|uniref:collagen alpha-1(I) chain-like n=1 Tax=Artibeus jamaicensis TaxID=9417 RepID=UPI00235A502F|nr:collagen alpha-1(I) chain-like [Artibeus jamaicensis]